MEFSLPRRVDCVAIMMPRIINGNVREFRVKEFAAPHLMCSRDKTPLAIVVST
jgi:hypothetical protein